ncbi:hypothetical protein Tco_1582124, partial [Tanacetum coccineum]
GGRKVPWPYSDKGRSMSISRKGADNHPKSHPKKSKPNMKFILAADNHHQVANIGRKADDMPAIEKWDDKLRSDGKKGRNPITCLIYELTITRNGVVQALIHTTRTLRITFRKHKVAVITDGPMEEILKLSRREGRLAKWAAEIRAYDISYIQRKEAEGSIVKKFFG